MCFRVIFCLNATYSKRKPVSVFTDFADRLSPQVQLRCKSLALIHVFAARVHFAERDDDVKWVFFIYCTHAHKLFVCKERMRIVGKPGHGQARY